jgi:predicted small metal-binding protein
LGGVLAATKQEEPDMRAVECVAPNCAHVHAADDEKLVREVMKHAVTTHPEMEFPEDAARQFVQSGGYDDTQHESQPAGRGSSSVRGT